MHARELRCKSAQIRSRILDAIVGAGKGHIGGAFSCTDILVALYHGGGLRVAPDDPAWDDRDRFILSKGHSAIALFAVLADMGFFDTSELNTLCRDGSRLGEHPDPNVPGVEVVTGSLGHGLGIGAGIALGAKLNNDAFHTVVLLGDGECHEGAVWEALMFASHHKLNNLTAIIDRNRQITLDFTQDCLGLDPLPDKLTMFGWEVDVVDGHAFEELLPVLCNLRSGSSMKPRAIVANTVKGKGVSFMERQLKWHHGMPSDEEVCIARAELAAQLGAEHRSP